MARFKNYSYDQLQLIPISFRHQILPGSFEYTLSYLIVHELDTSIFHTRFKNDDNGRPAYDPALLLKIVLLAYSKGITSSRKIEQLCRENIIFMAISANRQSHFTTIAEFISSWRRGIVEQVFGNVRWTLGFDGFSLRWKKKVNGQGKLMTTLHNLLKFQKYGTIG
jgi:transposase